MNFYLTAEQKQKIKDMMNPPGHNFKDINFIKVLDKTEYGYKCIVGYWITYLNCKPKYEREIKTFNV